MAKRVAAMILAVGVLTALVFASKWSPNPTQASGLVEADEIRLGSRLGGRVAKVLVEEGQSVQKGSLLVELEPFDLLERETELEQALLSREADYQRFTAGFRPEEIGQARAKFEQLQAKLDRLKAGPREQEIEATRGRLVLAQAIEKGARLDFDRLVLLAQANASSQQELDDARQVLDAASASVLVSQEELELMELGTREEEIREAAASLEEARFAWTLMETGYRKEDVQQAKAARDAAKARLDALRRQKEELFIRSPIDGNIESLTLQPGDMVAAGAPVLSMLDRHNLWVRAYVPQTVPGIQVGARISVSLDAYPEDRLNGVISFVSRQAEFTPSNVQTPEERSKQVFRIKVAIEDPNKRLRPGLMADVWLDDIGAPE